MRKKIIYKENQMIGSLVFITEATAQVTESGIEKRRGVFICSKCGNHFTTLIGSAKNYHTTSCGCSKNYHGLSKHRLYSIWSGIKDRCLNKKSIPFKQYGGRGISVCKEWSDDFSVFYKWAMQNGHKKELTIDRINNDGNYEPSNCRFATPSVQARNTKRLGVNNTSGFRGVGKKGNLWRARIGINSETVELGYFTYAYTAGYVYDSYVLKHNLEHTRNFN